MPKMLRLFCGEKMFILSTEKIMKIIMVSDGSVQTVIDASDISSITLTPHMPYNGTLIMRILCKSNPEPHEFVYTDKKIAQRVFDNIFEKLVSY